MSVFRSSRFSRIVALLLAAPCVVSAEELAANPPGELPFLTPPRSIRSAAILNEMVLDAISTMPSGGGYAITSEAKNGLRRATQVNERGELYVNADEAKPNFCSGATYLVFLKVIDRLSRTNRVKLTPALSKSLQITGQPDGNGVWGRWNANGPGTACLFHELSLGSNFASLEDAMPGDFMKIWWTDSIGSTEHGHSVVYMGKGRSETGEPTVIFWSANQGVGYSKKEVPRSRIKRVLLSRLERPEGIERALELKTDPYLAEMVRRPSSEAEVASKVGLRGDWPAHATEPAPSPAAAKSGDTKRKKGSAKAMPTPDPKKASAKQ